MGVARLIAGAVIAWQAVVLTTSDAVAIFVDFDQAYPNQSFTAYIDEKNAGKFPDVDKLVAHKARVTGKIVLYKNKPEIVVEEASQLVGE